MIYLIDFEWKIGYDKEVERLLSRPRADACWGLSVIFRALIDPIFEELNLIISQRGTRWHTTAVDPLDNHTSVAISGVKYGTTIATFLKARVCLQIESFRWVGSMASLKSTTRLKNG